MQVIGKHLATTFGLQGSLRGYLAAVIPIELARVTSLKDGLPAAVIGLTDSWRLPHDTGSVTTLQTIPTLALATPNAAFVPEEVSYYRYTVAPRLYYFSPPLLATLGLFLAFVAWRLVRRCCRCCCQWCCITPTEVRGAGSRTELRPPDSRICAQL